MFIIIFRVRTRAHLSKLTDELILQRLAGVQGADVVVRSKRWL
jgi:hypothetical protein